MQTVELSASVLANQTDPVAAEPRINTLDILRGAALVGMVLVHFHQRTRDPGPDIPGLEGLIGWVVWMGVEQKAHATFALLFGAGFAILMRRAEARGQPFVGFYLRRLLGLAGFGLLAEAFFGFQILTWYAISGMWLLLIRTWSTRALLIAALIAMTSTTLNAFAWNAYHLRTGGAQQMAARRQAIEAERGARSRALNETVKTGSYLQVLGARVGQIRLDYVHLRALIPGANLALFIMGLLAIRHGVFEDPRRHLKLIAWSMALGLTSWICHWWLLPRLPDEIGIAGIPLTVRGGLGIVSDQWLAFTYVGGLVLLIAYRAAWIDRLWWLQVMGRMALTNYFIQIAMIDFVAAGYGLNLVLRPYVRVAATILLCALLVGGSHFWLSRFRYGPLEWLWRCITYMRFEPMRAQTFPAADTLPVKV